MSQPRRLGKGLGALMRVAPVEPDGTLPFYDRLATDPGSSVLQLSDEVAAARAAQAAQVASAPPEEDYPVLDEPIAEEFTAHEPVGGHPGLAGPGMEEQPTDEFPPPEISAGAWQPAAAPPVEVAPTAEEARSVAVVEPEPPPAVPPAAAAPVAEPADAGDAGFDPGIEVGFIDEYFDAPVAMLIGAEPPAAVEPLPVPRATRPERSSEIPDPLGRFVHQDLNSSRRDRLPSVDAGLPRAAAGGFPTRSEPVEERRETSARPPAPSAGVPAAAPPGSETVLSPPPSEVPAAPPPERLIGGFTDDVILDLRFDQVELE